MVYFTTDHDKTENKQNQPIFPKCRAVVARLRCRPGKTDQELSVAALQLHAAYNQLWLPGILINHSLL